VDVWHWKDTEPQSVQIIQVNQERRATLAAVLDLASGSIRKIADADMRPLRRPRISLGDRAARRAVPADVAWGANKSDIYRVNLATGERTLIEKGLSRTMGLSPDGKWFLYLKGGHVFSYEMAAAKKTQIDGTKSFVNAEDDHDYEKPVYGVAGFTADGKSRASVRSLRPLGVAPHGWATHEPHEGRGRQAGSALSRDAARRRSWRRSRRRWGSRRWRRRGADRSREAGHALGLRRVDEEERVLRARARESAGAARLGRQVDRCAARREGRGPDDFHGADVHRVSNYWMSDKRFTMPRQVTDADPTLLKEFAWGTKQLVDYKNSKGQRLQATLTLPAGYEPGKKYPMLVYFYELMSDTHHTFQVPPYDDRPHMATYASNGYLVLQPDVVYEIGKPGSSALDCVTSAVKKVIELGLADPRISGCRDTAGAATSPRSSSRRRTCSPPS